MPSSRVSQRVKRGRRRRTAKPKLPKLTYAVACDDDACFEAIDEFLRSVPELKPLRAKLSELGDELRRIADYGLAERIEEAGNELRAGMLNAVVIWAFDQGLKEGQRLAAEASVTDASASRDPAAKGARARRRDHQ